MTGSEETASQLDTAIDSLLRDDVSPRAADAGAELTAIAQLLRDVLPRFHPRFGFEESLAGRIAAVGRARAAGRDPDTDGIATEPIPFPMSPLVAANEPGGRLRRRSLLAGGAIASGVSIVAIPLAGAVLMVWRRGRSSGGWL